MEAIFNVQFGGNDENGRLIEVSIPATTLTEAWKKLEALIGDASSEFWLNNIVEYK